MGDGSLGDSLFWTGFDILFSVPILEPQNRFTRREQHEQGSGRVAFFLFLGITAAIGWLYIFFMSEAFMVKDVEVRGVKTLDPAAVKREVFNVIDARPHAFWHPARHIWFLQTSELQEELANHFFTDHVTVDKSSYNVLRLSMVERTHAFIISTPSHFYWMDAQGVILDELNPQESHAVQLRLTGQGSVKPTDPPIMSIPNVDLLQVGQHIQEQDDHLQAWLDIALQVQKQGISYRQIQAPVDASSTKLTVQTMQGYEIWFDTYSDTLQTQIEAYKTFDKQKPKDLYIKSYVDVRVPDRVYVN